jgi:hypothetical protein
MIRQIVIEAEPGDDSQRVFCLSTNADVITILSARFSGELGSRNMLRR